MGATNGTGAAPSLLDHLSSHPVFSGIRAFTRSVVLCACFVHRFVSLCTFLFGHCVVCCSSIYRFTPLVYSNSSDAVNTFVNRNTYLCI